MMMIPIICRSSCRSGLIIAAFGLVTTSPSGVAAFSTIVEPSTQKRRTQRRWMASSRSMIPDEEDNIIHFNHAGASPSPSSVIERVADHMYLEQRLGGYAAAEAVQDDMKNVYGLAARLLHASSAEEIALVESATVGWTRLFYAMAEHHERMRMSSTRSSKGSTGREKVILISEAEYAAQVVAVMKWVREHDGWSVFAIPSALDEDQSSTGIVDLNVMERMLDGKFQISEGATLDPDSIAMVCITHVPTNSGIENPVEKIGSLLKKYKSQAYYLLDACQSVGQLDVNVQEIGCHGLCGTGRKYLRAPRGSGVLWVDSTTASILRPSHADHENSPLTKVPSNYPSKYSEVEVDYQFRDSARRFEFWESSAASKLGFGEAIRYALEDAGGMTTIAQKIQKNSLELQRELQAIDQVTLHYPGTSSGIITFQIEGMNAGEVKKRLWTPDGNRNRFDISAVPATSTPLDSARVGVPDLVRTSVSYLTTSEDIAMLIDRIKAIL